ncbi:MAG: sporulation protein Cse60 [Bacilli bacterium]|nr:sporulation protein Cse60 [Bacilli bacterium]
MVINIKVKIFDYEDEIDLEEDINNFISSSNIEVIDIKYQVSVGVFSDEQIFCFSALIIYIENK